ncbi:MAG: pseudouridine synthase [Candidatus Saccharibacteria bacterium]|nr:pseudouridine synthase [Candidatus Saccharibacteria bacterium]
MRLNKFIAENLGVSRRQADDLIASGRVKLRGEVALLGARLEIGDELFVDGKKIDTTHETAYTYIALNKPVGYVCSRKAQGDTPTLYDLLPEEYQSLKTVGRLDKNSSGLILLTNDGDFAYKHTHPSFYKIKVYEVTLDKALEPLHQQMISDFGVQLEDGPSKLFLERLDDSRTSWRVEMSEGRNRQIRRTFASLGYKVKTLHRISFGDYELGNLESGKFINL